MAKFEEIYAINVNDKTEKKGNLTYLSWAFAWAEFKKVYPEATYKIHSFDGTYCTGNEKVGYMVRTEVTAGEQTYEMWLPVMDGRNATILQPKMTEINKTIMRCLTKNLAMFGLGLYIYAGEDLPEGEESEQPPKGKKRETDSKNPPKTHETRKPKERLTKSELVQIWGVRQVEETVAWFEQQFGKPLAEWTDEETEEARGFLEQRKIKREREAEKQREALRNADGELPFEV
ncbi:MAG: DUF1071 domain-containing protein [Clostridia bacterium]|nr:DUF1071 domain-containing protein [Clostridia bacterium]